MKVDLLNLDKNIIGDIELSDHIFNSEIREDIIKNVIDWQRAKARAGTHSVKNVGEVSGTTKKPFKQKGTGNARQGNARGVQRRGGGIAHGPQVRSHAIKLQKKVRKFGLRSALSMKQADGKLYIIDALAMQQPKTAELSHKLKNFGEGRFFMIGENQLDSNFKLSSSALINANIVPAIGANVYDIVKSDYILIDKNALNLLEERLK